MAFLCLKSGIDWYNYLALWDGLQQQAKSLKHGLILQAMGNKPQGLIVENLKCRAGQAAYSILEFTETAGCRVELTDFAFNSQSLLFLRLLILLHSRIKHKMMA